MNKPVIIVADHRGKLEVERWVAEDGDGSIMISQTPAQAFHLALSPAEARTFAAALMDYADQQDLAEGAG